ncbi:hypothetical protein PITC_059700 [Penicillium italicum]|uniref:Zn(2)-C6 fungal-type domain-containing protein n=1 Tax=Penicillium italicum TaxID=40296 RepID=A0A0A2LMF0_PENIT|nr:hypothetical protein PITC_059700 [Penicillium italicum]
MAYSPDRLVQAQQVFDYNAGKFCMLPHLAGPYHLRQRASKRAAFIASWHDNDEDEDYTPSSELTPAKRKLSLFNEDDQDPRSDKRARSASPISTLRARLSSDTGNEDPVLPPTPSQHSEPDSWDRYWAVNPETETPNSRYSLRRRNKESLSESPPKKDTTEVEDSATKPSGDAPPADTELPLRGCDACKELGLECSLASDPDPFAYPCTTCEIDDVFCVVNPPPKWKRPCEICKGRKLCSYRDADYDHSQPCLECRNHGFECVAGPARHPPFALFSTSEPSEPSSSPKADSPGTSNSLHGGTPEPDVPKVSKPSEQISPQNIDSQPSSNPPHDTQEVDVIGVSKPPSSSAIQSKIQTPEINPTKNNGVLSSPGFSHVQPSVVEGPKPHEVITISDSDDDIPKTPKTPKRKPSPIHISDSLESPTRTTVSNTIASQSANTNRIWTELAHPVVFLADDSDGSPPCHWCNNFAYGINGLGTRNPEIWTFDDGTIVELQDGHTGEGKEQSRMCVSCTWDRCKIIQCSHNALGVLPVPLSPKDAARTDAEILLRQATDALTDPETGKAGPYFPSPIYEWCSLCREPAFGSCQALQPIDAYAEVIDCDAESRGCGLILCEYCLDLTKRFKGDLNAVVAWGRNDQSNPVPYRADVEYLLSGAENNTMYKIYMEER